MTEIESVVKPDGILDDLNWESVALVDRFGCIHDSIIPKMELTCQHLPEAALQQHPQIVILVLDFFPGFCPDYQCILWTI